ncbi:hypothetical protein [Allohahella marinimesophila]|uniref:Intracellular multiplication protein IcmP n=1 Tax=Allohahella marinimesophila TaxID=1054972 RepID=A0ABP7Q836_9GAMM
MPPFRLKWIYILVFGYLGLELLFVTAFINTYAMSSSVESLELMENTGRFITGLGCGIAYLVAKARARILERDEPLAGYVIGISFVVGLIGFFSVERILNLLESMATPEQVACAALGNMAKATLVSADPIAMPLLSDTDVLVDPEVYKIAVALTPLAVCMNDTLRTELTYAKALKRYLQITILGSDELKRAQESYEALGASSRSLYMRFVRAAGSHKRERTEQKFLHALLSSNNRHYYPTFRLLFSEISIDQARGMTEAEFFPKLVRTFLAINYPELPLPDVRHGESSASVVKKIGRLQISETIRKFDVQSHPELQEQVRRQWLHHYRLMIIPAFILTCSATLGFLTLAAVVRLWLLNMSLRRGLRAISYGATLVLPVVRPALMFALVLAGATLMTNSVIEKALFGDEENGDHAGSRWIQYLIAPGIKLQIALFPEVVRAFDRLGWSPRFPITQDQKIQTDMIRLARQSASKQRYLTPVAGSVVWAATVLSYQTRPPQEVSQALDKAEALYASSEQIDFREKALVLEDWRKRY